MKTETLRAIMVLSGYTAGRYDIGSLAGSTKAGCRVHLMSTLLGHRTPRSKSSVTSIEMEFYGQLGITGTGNCSAERADSFVSICKDVARGVV